MAHILLADADSQARDAAAGILRADGHEVDEASDGQEALDKLSLAKFDLVVTEIELGGLDGFELLQQVKTLAPEMPVLMLTGYLTIERALRARRLGAGAVMSKPVSEGELSLRVSSALETGGRSLPPLAGTVAEMTLGSALAAILRFVCEEVKAGGGAAYVLLEKNLVRRAAEGSMAGPGAPLSVPAKGAFGAAVEKPRLQDSEILVPIGDGLGFLRLVRSPDGRPFIRHDLNVAARSATEAAQALETARAQAALDAEKRKLESVFSETREGLLLIDGKGRVALINPSARALLGDKSTFAKSPQEAFIDFEASPAMESVVSSEKRTLEFELKRSKPKLLVLEGVRTRLAARRGSAPGQLFVFRDVTYKRRDEKIARDMLTVLSHKLRTPLAVTLGYQDLLLSEADTLQPAQRTALLAMKKQMEKFRYYVENFLILMAVLEAESVKLTKEECRPVDMIEEALKDVAPRAQELNVHLVYDLEALGRLKSFRIDRRHMLMAMRNLVENGIKFIGKTSGDRTVEISGAETNRSIVLHVSDNGTGIASEDHEKIFEKFYQIDDDFTGQVEGLGLGLAYVKAIAEAHGGSVRLESALGKGSTFTLELPA